MQCDLMVLINYKVSFSGVLPDLHEWCVCVQCYVSRPLVVLLAALWLVVLRISE